MCDKWKNHNHLGENYYQTALIFSIFPLINVLLLNIGHSVPLLNEHVHIEGFCICVHINVIMCVFYAICYTFASHQLFITIIYFVHACAHVSGCGCTCIPQSTDYRNCSSPPTMWALGVELSFSGFGKHL